MKEIDEILIDALVVGCFLSVLYIIDVLAVKLFPPRGAGIFSAHAVSIPSSMDDRCCPYRELRHVFGSDCEANVEIAERSPNESLINTLWRAIRYYGTATLGVSAAVFVAVELWRGLVWFNSAPPSAVPERTILNGDWLVFVMYGVVGLMYVRSKGRHHLALGLIYLSLATISVHGSLVAVYSCFASISVWPDVLRPDRSFLGIFNQNALAITCLVMSALLTAYLIRSRHRHR